MSTITILDGGGSTKYLESTGAGSVGDPFNPRSVMVGEKPDGTMGNLKVSMDGAILNHYDPHDAVGTSIHMTRVTGITDTFAIASVKGDITATVTNGAQWSTGDKIQITDATEANSEYDILTIKVIATNLLTFDRPLDIAHAIGTTVTGVTVNMAIDGSSTPQIFEFSPPETDSLYHVHAVNITFSSATEPALYKFGGAAALTNGLHFRVERTAGRDDTFWIPFRSLNAFRLSGWTYTKETKVGTLWFCHLSLHLVDEVNSVIYLDETLGEKLTCTMRDDNTDNTSMEIKLAVHKEPRA